VKKHWVRNPTIDTTIWSKLQSEVYDQREKECKDAICACWATDIDNQQSENIKNYSQHYSPNALFTGKKDKFVLECFAGKCPDGYHCENGNCIEDNLLLKNSMVIWQSNTTVSNVNRVKEIGIEYFLSKTNELYNKLYNDNCAFAIGSKRQIETEDFNVWKDAYNKKLDLIKTQIREYHELLVEYDAAAGKRMSSGSRGKTLIANDIRAMQTEMVKNFKSFNIAYTEVINTKANCPNCCTSVFSAYHRWYSYYFVKILSARP
jgi:ribosomal protein S27AE